MSSLLYAHLGCRAGTNSVFGAGFKHGPLSSTTDIPFFTCASLTDFFLPMKNLKELVQVMARLAAEQDFKN